MLLVFKLSDTLYSTAPYTIAIRNSSNRMYMKNLVQCMAQDNCLTNDFNDYLQKIWCMFREEFQGSRRDSESCEESLKK